MKLLYLPLCVIFYLVSAVGTVDPIDNIAALIRQGNVHELSKLFAPNIDITLLDQEDVYSGAQAELILEKFFNQNKPVTVKILHKVNSNSNYRLGVLIFSTGKETYRVAYTLKMIEGSSRIIELRIETEKVR